jgi:transposase, IS6 family
MRHPAKGFFAKALAAPHTSTPRVITVDKNAAYPKAFKELKAEGPCQIPVNCGRGSISTTSSSKTIASIKRLVKLGMASFRARPHGEPMPGI